MQIKEVPIEQVLQMRQQVLYPALSLEELRLPGDDHARHMGLYLDKELVSIVSVFVEGHTMQFRKFATEEHRQGKGFGTMLLRHVMEMAEEESMRQIWCNARTSALGFYERFGMHAVGDTWSGHGIEFVRMEKTVLQKEKRKKNTPMEIIPAIDIIDGKCVRLTQGDYEQKKIYNEHPLEVAEAFEGAGLKRLHLVDLDGAKAGSVRNWKVLEKIAGKTGLIIDFGGGIKTAADVEIVLNSGAALATVGSIAVKDGALFEEWLRVYGADKFLLGADVKEEKIAVGGWLETTDWWIYDFIQAYIEKGVRQIFCTDVSRDGLLQGPSLDLYKNILDRFPALHFIASGGVSGMEDIYQLAEIGCSGVIIGKAIYEGRVSLEELSKLALV